MDELPPDVAEVVRAGKRFCRLCWCNLDAGAEFCHHCGTEVKPVSPADVREAERAVKKLASLRNRAIFMPLLAVSLALALGPVMQSFGEASIYLFRAYIYVCVGLAATFSGLWGLGEFLNQDSKLRQNRVLRQRLRRLNLLTLLANGLSFVLVIVVGVVSVLLTLKLNR